MDGSWKVQSDRVWKPRTSAAVKPEPQSSGQPIKAKASSDFTPAHSAFQLRILRMERLSSDQEKTSSIAITVEFFGGLDILFSKQKKHEISIPAQDDLGSPINVAFLIKYLCDNLMRDRRKELFVQNETIRPGILVVINDADWELEGEEKYEIQPGDSILFMSTLHGG